MLVCAVAFVLQQAPEWVGTIYPEPHPPVTRDRVAFTKKLLEIREGMTPREVERILGKPDDLLGAEDCAGTHSPREANWMYGSTGKDSFAVYGEVTFIDGRVLGGTGSVDFDPAKVAPMKIDLEGMAAKDEAGVCDAMQKLWRMLAAEYPWDTGNAARERIGAVNALIALGKSDARIAVTETERLAALRYGAAALWTAIHPLFLSDDEGAALLRGRASWTIQGGVPLLLEGQWIGNGWSTVREFDELARSHAFRKTPFTPNSFRTLFQFCETSWATESKSAGLLGGQIESLLATVVEPPPTKEQMFSADRVDRARSMIASLGSQAVNWSREIDAVTYADGKYRKVRRPYYRAFIWQPGPLADTGVRITAKRVSPFIVYVTMQLIELTDNPSPPPPSFVVSVVGTNEESRIAFASFDSGEFKKGSAASSHVTNAFFSEWKNLDNGYYGSGGGSAGIGLDKGMVYSKTISLHDLTRFRLVIESEGKRFASSILVP